ncbi:protein phosphatase 1 regulatory subunit 12C [Struthio camelus]|uniref:protein phosphatase 1 regulatory subunit 12C n=1 Tax=Struthio camelus TaxID=8801 RepID=UPI0036042CD9
MAAEGGAAAAAAAARERRREQLRQWEAAAAAAAAGPPRPPRARAVRFERAAEFLAACAGADLAEAAAMVRAGGRALLNGSNADGISALHQACIDENMEVVRFLVESGADLDQADNEGWTPLHVAASCGYRDIARYLLDHGANVAAVNSDGDLALDVAEDDGMEAMLRAEVARRGVDVAAAKREEEERMLRDTRQWLNAGKISDARHPATGASALHVAAAKGYIEVMRLLLQAGYDPDVRDKDGWTPLHAAAHWGVEEACRLLAEHLCDMAPRNNVGQRPCDLADEETLPLLEELQRRQDRLRSQKEPPPPPPAAVIEPGPEPDPAPAWSSKHRRSSVCRMSSREKISVQDQSKERPALGAIALPDDDSGDEGDDAAPPPPGQPRTPGPPPAEAPAASCTPNGVPPDGKEPPWGLRKTGSLGALPPAGAPRDGAVKRSASSPRLAAPDKQDIWELLQQWNRTLIGPGSANKSTASEPANGEEGSAAGVPSKEPRLARVPPTPTRRIFALPDATPRTPPDGSLQPKPDAGAAPPAPPAPSADPRPRRSYQTPVRDEESESQRKARSRLMRQSRRSTQGVTLTELKEAEKTIGRGGEGRAPEQRIREDERRDREEGEPPPESTDPSWRSHVPAPPGPPGSQAKKGPEAEGPGPEAAAEQRSRPGGRERRKPRRERRGPGAEGEESDEPEPGGAEDGPGGGGGPGGPAGGGRGPPSPPRHPPSPPGPDYQKLYEDLWAENEKLKEQLQETELKLTQIKLELERVTQRQERIAERPALLELERFERRALERKAAELEEELKALSDLKADNQRLKDENAALIRVISKLSK